jgi:hypothetical protein
LRSICWLTSSINLRPVHTPPGSWSTKRRSTEVRSPSAAFRVPTASRVAIALLTVGLMPPAVVTTVVLGPLALTRSWLAAVDLDVQRLLDKIISRCLGDC